ncbi:hypothetical protein BGZ58_000686 [Dissophora ornata]|nr:hypothetical protein BGZ58_000686 [Dissophora ornata]
MASPNPQQSSTAASGPHRTAGHAIPRPRRYIGHYDIADRTFQLLSRHRAAACILFWSLTILLDILLQLPIEWFFLFYFILALVFRIFFIGGHIVLISIGAMCVSNAVVFYTVPFSFTSPFATGVAFGLMVSLIHGLNLKGVILAMTMYMLKPYIERQTLIAALNPPTVPSIVFLAPLASFCSAFGVLWLLYDLFGYLHASTDDLRDFFGITLPAPSIVTLKDVKDRSITLNWQCSSQATISKHLIEIDGHIVGESGKQETSVVIQGLHPDSTYRIRLWAVTTRNWKTPSDYIVVRTLASVPVVLELSSAEDIGRENEMIKKLIKESEKMQHSSNELDPDNTGTDKQGGKAENEEVASPVDVARTGGTPPANMSVTPTTAIVETASASISTISTDAKISSPVIGVAEEQISALKIELEGKEASHALLTQQLADLEKQYKQQEDNLKDEITTIREQQKQEDEPRQQAKAKLKELQDSLREAEAHKSKVEKEHRIELDKRQRMTEQLEAKQRKLQSLQQTLRQSEVRYQVEKESYQKQMQELETALEKRSEDVKTAESSLKSLQDSQAVLCSTIETKELELQKLQATIHSPKGHTAWEQKVKDLDLKCAQLTKQLEQHKIENQQLQDRLAEANKNVAKVRSARETRRVQAEARKASRFAASEAYTASDHRIQDNGSSWVSAGWNQSPGTTILRDLFQDDATVSPRPTPVRKTTGPPPGLPPKSNTSDASKVSESNAPGYERERKNSGSQGTMAAPGSPSRPGGQVMGPPRLQRSNSGLRPRSASIMSVERPFMDEPSGSRYSGMIEPQMAAPRDSIDRFREPRSRTSSVSSMNGHQSPLFEPSFVYSTHGQHQQDPNGVNQMFHQPLQTRQPTHGRQQPPPGHSQSPRARFQAAGPIQSPPMTHGQLHWGSPNTPRTKSGPISVSGGSRSPLADLDSKSSQSGNSSQPFNYHQFLRSPTLVDMPSEILSGTGLANDHQLNEQSVIESMFESPDTIDLRHHLRTVGSHSSLTSQSKILPSHLRSISTPGISSSLSSPTSGTLTPFQLSQSRDLKPIARPGSLGRMNSQAEGSSSSLNLSDPASPTSPYVSPFNQQGSGFGGKTMMKDSVERGIWNGYQASDTRGRGQETTYGSMNMSQNDFNATPITSESDIFGYGLQLNPFGWKIASEFDDGQELRPKEDI